MFVHPSSTPPPLLPLLCSSAYNLTSTILYLSTCIYLTEECLVAKLIVLSPSYISFKEKHFTYSVFFFFFALAVCATFIRTLFLSSSVHCFVANNQLNFFKYLLCSFDSLNLKSFFFFSFITSNTVGIGTYGNVYCT